MVHDYNYVLCQFNEFATCLDKAHERAVMTGVL